MKTSTLYWILGIIVIIGIITWIINNLNNTQRPYPYKQCSGSGAGQCGRDQYCDGGFCKNESNRQASNPIITQEVFDGNANPINEAARAKACSPECLLPYPDGSQYSGYYYCNKNCGVFNRNTPIYTRQNIIVRPTPTPTIPIG